MSGPIVRTGATPKFWENWDRAFGSGSSGKGKKKKSRSSAGKKKAGAKAKK